MRNLLTALLIIFCYNSVYAQDIYLKQNNFFTELVIAGAAENIKDVKKDGNSITVFFKKNLTAGFSGRLNDRFISKIIADRGKLTFTFAPDTNFTFMTEGVDAKIVASKTKKADDIKLGYGIEPALIKKGGGFVENTEAEKQMGTADELLAKGNNEQAIPILESLLTSDINTYYRQETLYRLGNAYYAIGKKSYKNYITASQIYDDFLTLYPDSYLYNDVLFKSAQAKEAADMYYEAIFSYEKAAKLAANEAMRKKALDRIADIYEDLGQTERAIAAREDIIRRFPNDKDPQTAIVAMLYAKQDKLDIAFRYYEGLTGRKVDFTKFDPESLYMMGEVFSKKNRMEEAYNAYRRAYTLFPNYKDADMAMYKSALMQGKLGNPKQEESLLLETTAKFPQKNGGMLAAVRLATIVPESKNMASWEKFLAPALTSQDLQIYEPAEVAIIKLLFRNKQYDKVQEKIKAFEQRSYNSPLMADVYDIEQRIMLAKARTDYDEGSYKKAQSEVKALLDEFPETPYSKEAKTISQSISYKETENKFKQGDFPYVINFTEKLLGNETEIIEPDKWGKLLDDAYYGSVKKFFDAKKEQEALVEAKKYIAQFGQEGLHSKEIRQMADSLILGIMRKSFDTGRFVDVIQNYSNNKQIIENSTNEPFKDAVKAYTAFALFKMSMPKESTDMLASVGNNKTSTYWLTKLLLGGGEINFQVNALDNETLVFLVNEAEKKNPDTALKMLNEYTKDPKLSEMMKFKLSKNISDNAKREALLVKIYQDVTSDPAKRFEGYEDVLLDMGILYYKKNNFKQGAEALENFLKLYTNRDEKRAEALYYTGKSYLRMKNNDIAVKNYMELLESVPKSIYASAARTELEEIQWRKSLTN